MKVSGFGSISSGGGVKRRGGVSSSGSFADLLGASEAGGVESPAATGVSSASPIANLLAMQEISDEEAGRKQAMRQGHDMLDSLEQLRRYILSGSVPMQALQQINRQLSIKKQHFIDPALLELIEDIELRASVELAKLETAMLNQRAGRGDMLGDDDAI